MQDRLLCTFGQLRERPLQIEPVVGRETLQQLKVELIASIPTLDRARGERELRESDDALGVEEADRSQTVASRARAHRIVERKKARLELRQRVAAHGAG